MKILKIVYNCLLVLIGLLLIITLIFASFNRNEKLAKIGNYSILVVEGKSMHPFIKNGDLIVIDRTIKKEYKVKDVVSFILDDGSIITHEIIDVDCQNHSCRYFTKGINNNYQDNDYIEASQIIGEYKGFRIPLLGYIVGFANTKVGYMLLVVLPLGIIFSLFTKELIVELLKKKGEY